VTRPRLHTLDRTLLGVAGPGLGGLETAPRDRDPRDRPPVAAATLPRALDHALRPADRGPPARPRRDPGPWPTHGRGPSARGCAPNPGRRVEAGDHGGRADRLPTPPDAADHAGPEPAGVLHRPRPGPRRPGVFHGPPRACGGSSASSCSPPRAGVWSTSRRRLLAAHCTSDHRARPPLSRDTHAPPGRPVDGPFTRG